MPASAMHSLYVFSVWIHILAAIAWIGGMLFLVTVMVPLLRKPEMRAKAAELFHVVGLRFRTVGWVALGLLVLTGITNLAFRGYSWAQVGNGQLFAGPFGHTLATKLVLVLALLVLGVVHDFWLGPRATILAREKPNSPERERARKIASWMGRTSMLLALAVVALAVMLVRG